MGVAVVTGASAGLGEHFALQLQHDPEIDEIWLVARRGDRLQALADRLQAARGVPIVADLSRRDDVSALASRLAEAGPALRVLVNNAGFAVAGDLGERSMDQALEMVDLNVRALVQLTRAALDHMTPGARIIQVASTIGYFPFPGFAVYAATKAFVIEFSVALAAEMAAKGIRVTGICPGATATEFWSVATDGKNRPPPWVSSRPEQVVRTALRHSHSWRWLVTPGLLWTLTAWLSHLAPRRIAAQVTRWFNPY